MFDMKIHAPCGNMVHDLKKIHAPCGNMVHDLKTKIDFFLSVFYELL